jgi:hypothetical protein
VQAERFCVFRAVPVVEKVLCNRWVGCRQLDYANVWGIKVALERNKSSDV